ncbi:MAG: hypothetical protein QOD45_1236 [Pseudonocardiales bacterium]|jgi:hypothetical protein|nr:hypothetical protein [Pseudonocardiales bacterium]
MARPEDDDELLLDGDPPMQRLRAELRLRPALVAVAVELAFVLVLGNQWMFDHVVEPWSISTSGVRRGVAQSIGWFSWLLAPQHGLTWVWLGGLLHAVVWLLATYWLVRLSVRTADPAARFLSVIGSVLIAAILALLVTRLVSYPDVSRLYGSASDVVNLTAPGFLEWVFLGSVGGGAIVAVAVVGVLAGSALAPFVLPADDADADGTGSSSL